MQEVSDCNGGFSIEYRAALTTIVVRAHGHWSIQICSAFAEEVQRACYQTPAADTLALELVELKPLRAQGETAFAELFGGLRSSLWRRTRIVASSHLVRLQVARVAEKVATRRGLQMLPVESTEEPPERVPVTPHIETLAMSVTRTLDGDMRAHRVQLRALRHL